MTRYRLFGLSIDSAFDLPDMPPAEETGVADVVIERGEATRIAVHQGPSATEGGAGFAVAGVARFDVSGGSRIVVMPDPAADPRNVRLYLQGSALGLLLHQRGLLPLHANAIAIDGRAFAFMGESGAGKSTLAAWFHDRRHALLTDDVCVVTFSDDGQPLAWPGLPRLRLWREAVVASGRLPEALESSFVGDSEYDKFDVPMAAGRRAHHPLPLAGIFVLEVGASLEVKPLAGTQAVQALFAHTYRGAFVASSGDQRAHWRSCVALARAGLVHRLVRPWGHDRIDEVGAAILAVTQD